MDNFMNISEFLASFALGGFSIGAIIIGLSKFLGSIWAKRIERIETHELAIKHLQENATIDKTARSHQSKIDERLKNIEQDHAQLMSKDEKFHQISKETYQKLFEKKLEVYHELAELKYDYLSRVSYFDAYELISGYGQVEKEYQIRFERLQKVIEHINNNRLYITKALTENVIEFNASTGSRINNYNTKMEHDVSEGFLNPPEFYIEEEDFAKEVITKNSDLINKILNQIDDDLFEISKIIHQH